MIRENALSAITHFRVEAIILFQLRKKENVVEGVTTL
jgi:hypothetical protein